METTLKVGDVVYLKSKSPAMVITFFLTSDKQTVKCVYYDFSKCEMKHLDVNIAALTTTEP